MAFKMKQKTGDNIRLYHTDHLGSTALVTDIDGEVTQHVAYIPYGEIFVEQRNGSWSSPYLFNAKELDEETGLYYYGARYLDPTNAAWLSVDPLFEKYVGMTPYGYCAGNPIGFIDPTGMFKMATYTDEELSNYGLTREELTRFEALVKNIGNIVNNNPDALSAISNTTGLTEDQIKKDMVFGEGPTINIINSAAFCSNDDIYINAQNVKYLANASMEKVRGKTYTQLDLQCFLTSMTILHEYGHYGDQKTNGTNTGQYTIIKGIKEMDESPGWNMKPAKAQGIQNWHESKTGHRGNDVTFIGFGVVIRQNDTTGGLELDNLQDSAKRNKTLNNQLHTILKVK